MLPQLPGGTIVQNKEHRLTSIRMELATLTDTLYAVTVNSTANLDSCYKSIDGGATWI